MDREKKWERELERIAKRKKDKKKRNRKENLLLRKAIHSVLCIFAIKAIAIDEKFQRLSLNPSIHYYFPLFFKLFI